MENISINLIITITGCIIATATFFIGRLTNAKTSGQEWGEMKSDIKHIRERVDNISDAATAALEKEMSERKEADRRLHTRIDEHIAKYHSKKGD